MPDHDTYVAGIELSDRATVYDKSDQPVHLATTESNRSSVAVSVHADSAATNFTHHKKYASKTCCCCFTWPWHTGNTASRTKMRDEKRSYLFANVSECDPHVQRSVERSTWWCLWVAVTTTLGIVSYLYNHVAVRTFFATQYTAWAFILAVWIVFTICAQIIHVQGWGLGSQIAFVLVAVLVHSTVLSLLCAIVLHRVGTFSVVFFFYLLTAKAVWTLRPCPGTDYGASLLLLICMAIALVCVVVVPLHTNYDHWFEYPYSSWATYLEPPIPVWRSYAGALVATLQMIWVTGLYTTLTHKNDQSQAWYFVGRMYLVVVYGWQLVWYFFATRGCRRGCLRGTDLPCVS
jgi:hypothetical protein